MVFGLADLCGYYGKSMFCSELKVTPDDNGQIPLNISIQIM